MDIIACILGSLWHNSCHVYRGRPQPQIAARDPVAPSLSRGRQGQEEDPGESDRLAEGVDRRLPGPAEGRKGGRRRAGGGVDPPVVAARARRGGAGNIAGDRLGPRPRTARQSPPRPGHRHGREPADRAGLEAGDGPRARSGDRHLQPRRGAGLAGCRRRRALRRLGLAAATAAGHREVPGQEAPRRRRAGPLRRHLELPRGPLLPPGQARLQPRRQEGQAADRLWPAVRRRRLPGGGRSVRRRHRRSQDPGRPDRQAQGPLRLDARGARRRPRHDHPSPPRRRDQAGRARLDHRPAGAGDPGASRRRSLPARLVRRAGHGLDHLAGLSRRTADGLPQSGTGALAGQEARGLAERHRTPPRPIREAVRRARNPLRGKTAIALKVGAVLNKHKMAKHFETTIAEEAALDGCYVVRTNLPTATLDDAGTVAAYKRLSGVERVFRSLKTVDLEVRPIFHWASPRVKAHVLLCMLAYYVEHHMRARLGPLLYDDTDREAAAKLRNSVVAKAQRSPAARRKETTGRTEDGLPVQSFQSLLADLATYCRMQAATALNENYVFTLYSRPTQTQARAFELLGVKPDRTQ